MADQQRQPGHEFGMVGWGAMGRHLWLNLAEYGWSVAGDDKAPNDARGTFHPEREKGAGS